jgi:flavin-dependent dehydrogenase
MMAELSCDVCVIGGGPAGAAVAARLTAYGHDVRLIERTGSPTARFGQCLSPGALPLLEALGLATSPGVREAEMITRWAGAERRSATLVLDRGAFDASLLEAAEAAGVRVHRPATAGRLRFECGSWHVEVRERDRRVDLECRFVVDAGGRPGALRRPRIRSSARTTALYGRWRAAPQTGVRVEAGHDAWFWAATLPDSTLGVMAFLDRERCAGLGRAAMTLLYRALISTSELIGPYLDAPCDPEVRVCDASGSVAVNAADRRGVKVGEAAIALDPLSSQGVQTALATAMQGGIVAHTALRHPDAAPAAIAYYREYLRRLAGHHDGLAADHYRRQAETYPHHLPFWSARARPYSTSGLSAEVYRRGAP